jgi:alpha-L-rhamnosidase
MMKKLLFSLILCMIGLQLTAKGTEVTKLRVNRLSQPTGIVDQHPMLSWQIISTSRNVMQTAYEIEMKQGSEVVWKTGKVKSDISIGVPYQGNPLESGTLYTWRVRIWDSKGNASAWSNPSGTLLTGLLTNDEWKAKWIEPLESDVRKATPAPIMRKQFSISKPIVSAVAFITSHGMNESFINGKKISDYHFAPGWTTYNKRLQYYTFDVTPMLHQGDNVFGMMLAEGWMLSPLSWNKTYYYSNLTSSVGAFAQIVLTYKDGSKDVIATDGTWKYSTCEVLGSTIYDGETIDANKVQTGWNNTGFNDSKWNAVKVANYNNNNLVNCENEPVVTHKLMKPVKVITTPKGEKVIDFGQNLVGHEIFTFKGNKGQKVTILHAEVLDEKGNFYTTNLRSAKATSNYICSGGTDTFEPRFTFYGFRYIKVEGINGALNPDDFVAAVTYSGIEHNGDFSCSNDSINQLQSNIQWGLRGNFVDIPTDCPQRDERLGWTGDAEVFFRTATFNARVENFFKKWLKDLTASQRSDGRVTDVIPDILTNGNAGRTGWADVATIIPWEHYVAYGDKQVLINQLPSMKAWVNYMTGQSKNYLWTSGWHYGDWLAYSVPNDCDGNSSVTSKRLIQQCFFAYSADLVAKAAAVLGNKVDAAKYSEISRKAKAAFCDAYLTKTGNLMSDTQTAYVLALNFDMLPDNMRPIAAKRLAELVNQYGHITTGFLGTPHICHVLTEYGYSDLAYELLLHKDYPGWLYPVIMGATTIWERWNSVMPDHTIPDNGMNSLNHYSYGAIGDWLYRDAVGIQETSPAFKTIRIMPHLGGGFKKMSASENTPFGEISASWQNNASVVTLDVTIPANTTAEIYVPAKSVDKVTMDGKRLKDASAVNGYVVVKTGSGKYQFVSNNK